eukprot:8115508-Lingulodinium_polyedra.AAC.1
MIRPSASVATLAATSPVGVDARPVCPSARTDAAAPLLPTGGSTVVANFSRRSTKNEPLIVAL